MIWIFIGLVLYNFVKKLKKNKHEVSTDLDIEAVEHEKEFLENENIKKKKIKNQNKIRNWSILFLIIMTIFISIWVFFI